MSTIPAELQKPELLNHSAKMESGYLRRCAAFWEGKGFGDYAQQLRGKADQLDQQHEKDSQMTPAQFAQYLKNGESALPVRPSLDEQVRTTAAAVGRELREQKVHDFAAVVKGLKPAPKNGVPWRVRLADAKLLAESRRRQRRQREQGRLDRFLESLHRGTGSGKMVHLTECDCLQASGVDDNEPVIQRVKILGWESKNRRRYLPESIQTSLYEGSLVNIDHPDNPNASRSVRDRFGRLEDVTIEATGAYGNLRYNPKHPLAEQVKWAAVHMPELYSLSHNAVGTGKTVNGVFIVEKVVSVRSVDLVADGATTGRLTEGRRRSA